MLHTIVSTFYLSTVFIVYFTSVMKHPKVVQALYIADVLMKVGIRLADGSLGTKFKIEKKKGYTVITYAEKEKGEKTLIVPTNRKITLKRNLISYYAVKDGKRDKINVSPDFPILVSAKDLGVDLIEARDLKGKFIRTYDKNEVPNY